MLGVNGKASRVLGLPTEICARPCHRGCRGTIFIVGNSLPIGSLEMELVMLARIPET